MNGRKDNYNGPHIVRVIMATLGICLTHSAMAQDDESRTLRLLVLGQSKSGKSTWMNNFYNVVGGSFNRYHAGRHLIMRSGYINSKPILSLNVPHAKRWDYLKKTFLIRDAFRKV